MYKLSFVGDLMFKKKSVTMYVQNGGRYNFDCCFDNVNGLLHQSDFLAGNLETTVADFKSNDFVNEVDFNAPVEFLDGLKNAGFDYLSTGNNHCLNRKKEGLIKTIDNLDARGFLHGGTYKSNNEKKRYEIIQFGECKIAIMSYTFSTNPGIHRYYLSKEDERMVNLVQPQQFFGKPVLLKMAFHKFFPFRWIYRLFATFLGQPHFGEQSERQESQKNKLPYRNEIKQQLQFIKDENPDYIIMMLHAGSRYHKKPAYWQRELVDFLLSNGVDIIVGAHTHRVQRCEISCYNDKRKFVAYDLGNFCSTTGVVNGPYNKLSEYSIILNFYIDEHSISKISFVVCKSVLNKDNKVVICPAYDLIQNVQSEEEQQKLTKNYKKVASIFMNKKCTEVINEHFIYSKETI